MSCKDVRKINGYICQHRWIISSDILIWDCDFTLFKIYKYCNMGADISTFKTMAIRVQKNMAFIIIKRLFCTKNEVVFGRIFL